MSVSPTAAVTPWPQTAPAGDTAAKVGSVFKDALDNMRQGMATGAAAHAGIRPDQGSGTLDAQVRTGHSVNLKV